MRYMSVLPRSSMRHSAAAPGLLRPMPESGRSASASAHSEDSSLYSTCNEFAQSHCALFMETTSFDCTYSYSRILHLGR